MRPNKYSRPLEVSWEEMPLLMTVEYVAVNVFDTTVVTIQNWINEKGFPVFILCDGGVRRVEKNALREWITQNMKKKEAKQHE